MFPGELCHLHREYEYLFSTMKNKSEIKNRSLALLFTGGATGGHLYPALALAEEVSKYENCLIAFAGSRKGIEAGIIPDQGYDFYPVWISGLQRKRFFSNLLLCIKIPVSLFQAIRIILHFNPDIIIGTGGYVSWPVLTAGIMLRKRIIIQEQNQFPGLVTRMIAPYADSVHLSFESSKRYFKKKSNLHISGNPTRGDLVNKNTEQSYDYFQLDSNKITLFILGGSQGSLFINRTIIRYLPRLLKETDVQILWSTGENWYEWIKKETEKYSQVKVYPYIREMGYAYSVCDLIICRAGATTVAEITSLGIPTVFIPLSTSAADHQLYNARILAQAKAAEMVLEPEIDQRFFTVVKGLINNKDKRKTMGKRAKEFSKPKAAEIIVRDIVRK